MPNRPPSYCRICKISGNVRHVSKRGLCTDCAERRMLENINTVRNKSGPEYEEWLRRWRAGCGDAGRPITPYPPDA